MSNLPLNLSEINKKLRADGIRYEAAFKTMKTPKRTNTPFLLKETYLKTGNSNVIIAEE